MVRRVPAGAAADELQLCVRAALADPRTEFLPASVASQYFLAKTDVTQVNISHNGRQKGRNGRRTTLARPPDPSPVTVEVRVAVVTEVRLT
jgi:hypothetical protein